MALLGVLLLSTTITYAGRHPGYVNAPGGATLGFGDFFGEEQINPHTIRVYCTGDVGLCWMIHTGTLYTGPDILPSYTPDPGGSVTLPVVDITDLLVVNE